MADEKPAARQSGDDLAARVRQLEDQLAASEQRAARAPILLVPANGGGPGNDDHRDGWNLAAQEAAQRGETVDL